MVPTKPSTILYMVAHDMSYTVLVVLYWKHAMSEIGLGRRVSDLLGAYPELRNRVLSVPDHPDWDRTDLL